MNIAKLKKAYTNLKSADKRKSIVNALTMSKTIVGATLMESLKKDPRRINCQVAFVSMGLGTDNRLYDVQMLQKIVKDTETLVVNHSQLIDFGIISPELKAHCFHEDRIMDVDLSYPIIVDFDTGLVLDGRHRLAKSKALGQTTIAVKAVNMNTLPYAHRDIFNKLSFVNM